MSQPGTPDDEQLRGEIGDPDGAEPTGDVRHGPAEPTGHAGIDAALERLDHLHEHDDISSHPAEFDAIHRVLRESLASAGRDEGE